MDRKALRRLMPSAVGAIFVLAAEKYGEEQPRLFLDRFERGEGLTKGDPVYELRERLISNASRLARLDTVVLFAITVKAVNAFVHNRQVGLLRWTPNETFPTI
jgi:hypothetical protein